MTKRDFQTLAVALYEARMTPKERLKLADIIATVCLRNNIAFDLAKFYEAAGIPRRMENNVKKETK
jgi:hypothetical protein